MKTISFQKLQKKKKENTKWAVRVRVKALGKKSFHSR